MVVELALGLIWFFRGRWAHSSLGVVWLAYFTLVHTGGTSGVVGFTKVHPVVRWVHPGSLGFLGFALGSLGSFGGVGFSRVCPRVRLVDPESLGLFG